VKALLRSGPNVKYEPNRAYADAKVIVAWWEAALARRLPPDMAVYAVSPGSTPDTKGLRNAGPALKWLMVSLVKLIPGDRSPSIPSGIGVRNRCLGAILRLGAQEAHRPY
jgi:hypothetical protein